MITAAQLQNWIVREIKDADTAILMAPDDQNGGVPVIVTLWERFGDKALIAPRLQALYTKRACLDVLIASHREDISFKSPDLAVDQDQLTSNLTAMLERTQAEIDRVERKARAVRPPAVGQLTEPGDFSLPHDDRFPFWRRIGGW